MQRTIITGSRLLATIALAIAVSAGVATAQVKKGKTRSLQTGQVDAGRSLKAPVREGPEEKASKRHQQTTRPGKPWQ